MMKEKSGIVGKKTTKWKENTGDSSLLEGVEKRLFYKVPEKHNSIGEKSICIRSRRRRGAKKAKGGR